MTVEDCPDADDALNGRIKICRQCDKYTTEPETYVCVRCGYTKCYHLMKTADASGYDLCFACTGE